MRNFRTTPYHSVVVNEIYLHALKLLRIRDYTVSELRAKLETKFGTVPPELIEQLLQKKFVKPDWPSLQDALAAKMKDWALRAPLRQRDAGRLFRALLRLGFDEDAIREEIERINEQ
jgi:SOS response regulatory protein OraA/RecX